MLAFGLSIGLVFPYIASPFVTWDPEKKIYFRLACLAAGLAVGSFCYYLVKITLYQRNKMLALQKRELEEAKSRFGSLTHNAIESQMWDVSFEDSRVPTCWQTKDCSQGDCPAFGREHLRCWLIAGTYCGGQIQGRFAQKLGDCSKCDVYLQAVGENPISEIGENFNSLMLAVREKEDLLAAANEELKDQYIELELLHRQAREMANTDLLTGLRNHAHFQHHIRWEIDKAGQGSLPLSLIMLDLDHFKSINDSYGHQKGDEVLKRVGKKLSEEIKSGGYAARYGGEEFVVLLPGSVAEKAMAIADRLRDSIKEIAGEIELPQRAVGASFGVADLPECASDAGSLISAADSALLFAKRRGRDRVAYFKDLNGTELQEGDVERLHNRLEGASLQTIRALAEAVDANDDYTLEASSSMDGVAAALAEQLGLDKEQADTLFLASRLHDIGKIGVPGSILRKTEKLSVEELAKLQQHPEIGQRILQEAMQLQDLISAILYHHERWDGTGYPERLHGKQIPLTARIVGIMDAYRAMRSDRPYRKALSRENAITELEKGAGTQFDPRLVKKFVELARQDNVEKFRRAG
ncbi:MAG: diguanylate cyclase [Actinobacteria bacterium]|nr:diguanylate cyclase [Actinomycetota bacterium]MCL5882545.1 diguanylate cyclase [Actinomycetota bacterium]